MFVKRFLAIAFLIFFDVLILNNNLLLSQSTIEVSLPDTSYYPGTSFKIPIIVSDLTDKAVYSVGIKISFDPNVLKAVGATTDSTIASEWGAPTFNSDSAKTVIGIAGTTPLVGSGKLIYILFDVAGSPGDTTGIHFLEFIFNEGTPAASTNDGFFTVVEKIKNPELFVSPTTLDFGTSKETMSFSISNLGGDTLFWNISDTSNWITNIDPSSGENDTLVTVSVNRLGLPPGDYSSNLVINSNAGSQQVTLNLSVPAVTEVMVSFPDTTASVPGQIINIPIIVGDVTGKNIYSIGAKITFNSHILGLLNVVTDSSLCSEWSSPTLNQDTGKVTIGIAGTVPLAGSGNLFFLKFNVIGSIGDTTHLHFLDFFFNEGNPKTMTQDGLFIVNLPSQVNSDLTSDFPKHFLIKQNYPNPFNSSTTISFQIPTSSYLALSLYDVAGRLVTHLTQGYYQPGTYSFYWNGTNAENHAVPSGIYFYQLKTSNKLFMKKMILLR